MFENKHLKCESFIPKRNIKMEHNNITEILKSIKEKLNNIKILLETIDTCNEDDINHMNHILDHINEELNALDTINKCVRNCS